MVPQLFVGIDVSTAGTAFDHIAQSDVPKTLSNILANTKPAIASMSLESPIHVHQYNTCLLGASVGDVIILRASLALLQAASTRPVTDADFSAAGDVSNCMAIKLDGPACSC